MGWVTLQFHGNEHGSVVGAIAMEKLASVGKSTASPLSRVAATASSGDAVAIGVVIVTIVAVVVAGRHRHRGENDHQWVPLIRPGKSP